MCRHVLRNSTRTLPLILTLNCSEAVLTLAGLGFLGFGIEPTAAADWGYDLEQSLSDVTSGIWWTAMPPGLAIVLTVLGLTLVGETLNDLADPRLRRRRRAAGPVPHDLTVAAPRVPGGLTARTTQTVRAPDVAMTRRRHQNLHVVRHRRPRRRRRHDVAAGEVLAIVGESGSGKTVTAARSSACCPRRARRAAAPSC